MVSEPAIATTAPSFQSSTTLTVEGIFSVVFFYFISIWCKNPIQCFNLIIDFQKSIVKGNRFDSLIFTKEMILTFSLMPFSSEAQISHRTEIKVCYLIPFPQCETKHIV